MSLTTAQEYNPAVVHSGMPEGEFSATSQQYDAMEREKTPSLPASDDTAVEAPTSDAPVVAEATQSNVERSKGKIAIIMVSRLLPRL